MEAMNYIKNGFSLLEILLVVAVGSVFILASLKVYSRVNDTRYVNDQVEMISILKETIYSLYSGYVNFNGLTNEVLIGNGVIPEEYVQGTDIVRPEGTVFRVETGWNDAEVRIRIYNYKSKLCGQIVMGVSREADIIRVHNEGANTTDTISTAVPMTPAKSTKCKGNSDPSVQAIRFVFTR